MLTWRLRLLGSRIVRAQVLAVAVLSLAFIAALVLCFAPAPDDRAAMTPSLHDMLKPPRLPGAPLADDHEQPEPLPLQGSEAARRNADAPLLALGPAAPPFHYAGSMEDRHRARTCLAAAMVYEAGGDPVAQLSVGQVVLNRVRHPAFPSSVCGVVAQGSQRSTGCQFTFTCDGSLTRRRPSGPAFRAGLARAELMLSGFVFSGVGLATHYHTDAVYPWWSPRLDKIARVGAHLFFRWPGYWGSAGAMRPKGQAVEASAALFAALDPNLALAALPDGTLSEPQIPLDVAALAEGAVRPTPAQDRVSAEKSAVGDGGTLIPPARRLAGPIHPAAEPRLVALSASVLGGNRLIRMFPEQGIFYLELTKDSSEAARRRAAELLCGGRATCQVYGWRDAAAAPSEPRMNATAKATLAFRFVRAAREETGPAPPPINAL